MPIPRFAVSLSSLLCACSPNVTSGTAAGEFEIPAGIERLRVTLEKGEISLLAAPERRIRYDAATRRGATDSADLARLADVPLELEIVEGEPGELWLRGPRVPAELAARDPGAALVLKVRMFAPPDLEVVLESDRGRLGVNERTAPVELHTGAGDIHMRSVHARAKTFTGSGNHFVIDHRGDLACESEHGDYFVYVTELGAQGASLAARSGNIQCNLPPGTGFTLDASTRLGEIKSGLPLEVEVEGHGASGSGAVAGGGPAVSLTAERGNINIREKVRIE